MERLKILLNRRTEHEQLILKEDGLLELYKNGSKKTIGKIFVEDGKEVYYKVEDEHQIHRNSNSWSINRVVADAVDEVRYETDKALYTASKATIMSNRLTFPWDSNNGLDKKFFLPLPLWNTKYKDPLANSLIPQMGQEWYEVLQTELRKDYMNQLRIKLIKARKISTVYPDPHDVFRAFKLTSLSKVKVLILGQDPYHDGNASGLAFHPKTEKYPPSFMNIHKEVEQSVYSGLKLNLIDLEDWASQGVFLLNTTLTVRKGEPESHFGWGWETFTKEVIRIICKSKNPIVVMLWGNKALETFNEVEQNHPNILILQSAHPSPLSAHRGFFGNGHFNKCNEFLTKHRIDNIVW